jgi:1-acyl-sn-glycerol-3-phosphate acyltransferase
VREPVERLFPPYSRTAYRAIKAVVGGVMNRSYKIVIDGMPNVPVRGPAIVAANHLSFLDSFFIPLVIPRRVTYLAKAEYWDTWKTRWFFEAVGQIPVRRQDSAKAQGALEAGKKVLENSGLLGIYPEGTRSPDGRLYKGKTGVARMAAETGVPVIPVGLVGTDRVMPRERKLPKFGGSVGVRFGAPMRISAKEAEEDPLALRSFTDELMFQIRQLSGQQYTGRYADKRPAAESVAAA